MFLLDQQYQSTHQLVLLVTTSFYGDGSNLSGVTATAGGTLGFLRHLLLDMVSPS